VPGAEAEQRSAAGDHVQGRDVGGQQDRLADGGVGDVRPEPDGRGDRGGRGQRHERRRAGTGVVGGEQGVEAGCFRPAGEIQPVGGVLGLSLEREVGHGAILAPRARRWRPVRAGFAVGVPAGWREVTASWR
jgi:hypothetical protein